jgi:RNA-directed DNA polymerase
MSLAHLLTPEFLTECFMKLNQYGAPGPDGVTMEEFTEKLEANIAALHNDLQQGRYRATSVRRVYIPKANGKLRPLGIPTVRDRVVQRAVAEILGRIYEPYFIEHSYGFRPRRSCHDAIAELRRTCNHGWTHYVVEADIKSYFDTVNHDWLMKFLAHRVADPRILRLVKKWLNAGYMDKGTAFRSEEGTPQGGPISPLLANIYLHYVLDLWFERRFRKSLRGKAEIIRYADDFVVCFQFKDEAERFLKEMTERFTAFNLQLAADKTKLIEFGKAAQGNEIKGQPETRNTFDFLGFTHYMRKRVKRTCFASKPSIKSRNKFLATVKAWLTSNMHSSVFHHAKVLARKLRGFYNYFGLRYCMPSLRHIKFHAMRVWFLVLRRRSQKDRLTWESFLRRAWCRLVPDPSS